MTNESTIRLADLCDLVAEQVDPRGRPDDVYVGLEHVASGRFLRAGQGKAADVRSAKSAFQPGDVLYGKLRPYLDKAVLAEDAGICTTELLVLRAKEGVAPRFLVGVVHFPEFVEYAVSGITGAHHPRTSWAHIREFRLPASVRDEQEKIAELLWLVHGTIAACEASIEAGRSLKRATMRKLFTRGLRGEARKRTEIGPMPQSWERLPISALGKVVTGNTPSTKDTMNYAGGKVPFIGPGDIEHGCKIEKTEKLITEQGLTRSRPITAGTICFVCIGSTIGKVGYVTVPVCATNQQINSIFSNDNFDSKYIFYLMTFWANHIRKWASPSPVPILSKGVFEQIEILTSTDPHEQREIARILGAIDRKIYLHRKKCAVLDDLFKTLLHKLMTGETRTEALDFSALSAKSKNLAT